MVRTRVKICGICRPEDALAAARAGADAIGMVFDAEAGRCVREADVPGILAVVPPFVSRVALFVNHSVEDIKSVLQDHPFSAVQLHGDESPEFVDDLKPTRVIKAIHLAPGDMEPIELWRGAIRELQLTNLAGILLETPRTGEKRGGTGVPNNFAALREMQAAGNFEGLPPIILAGGLTPENVADAIRLLHPYAVDVSSGVEAAPRKKSAEKIEAFIWAVESVQP
jgi:phosphoribosylanthranilate isomerase